MQDSHTPTETKSPRVSWERFTKYYFTYVELGIALDISHMRFPDSFLDEMRPRCLEALAMMRELESGAIANPDEKRMVGHYWLRNPALSPTTEIRQEIEQSISAIRTFARAIHDGSQRAPSGKVFSEVLVIGIGGSALGPQLLGDLFSSDKRPMRLHFIDNTDPDGMERCFTQLRSVLSETLVLVVSKSGGTLETRNGQRVAQAVYEAEGLQFADHAIAITVENSALDKQAKEQDWCAQFYLWDWVGGRTSIFSAVGLLPSALFGLNIEEFLRGAAQMDELTRGEEGQNPALLLALMWYWAGDGRGDRAMVVLPYKDRLLLFSKYLQQLVMESIGKERDLHDSVVNQGLSVFGNKGSTDQHAYVQQLRDGRSDFFATFIEVLQQSYTSTFGIAGMAVDQTQTCGDYLEGFLLGTRAALFEGERDSLTVTLDEISEFSIGALIALYERAVGFYASLIQVNAYHQPGVEAGKKAAATMIELQRKLLAVLPTQSSPLNALELAEIIDEEEHAGHVFKLLCAMAHDPNSSVRVEGLLHPLTAKFYPAE